MALTFENELNPMAAAAAPAQDDVEQYDIVADRQAMNRRLDNSPEIDALTSLIEVDNMESIITFGAKAAEGISRAADEMLKTVRMSQVDDSGQMLNTLAKIMDKFDIDEIKETPSGFLGKIFGNPKKQLDRILDKYHTMGDEVDKIYVQLKQYEGEIRQSNNTLQAMFDANVEYYHELVKYILAGEQGCREIKAYLDQRKADLAATGDMSIQFEVQTLEHSLLMLEQRTQDLRIAENVAMQSIPMLRMVQFSNMNLVRKINSAFIVTLPVFKQALAQAIMLKRQRIQADAISALDERTNKMLVRNARNAADQAALTARLAAGSSVKMETLEKSFRTIVNGIDETRAMQETARQKRVEEQARLEAMRRDYKEHFHE